MEAVLFYLLGGLAVLCSLALVTARRAVTAIRALGGVMLSLAGVFLLLRSPFIAVVELLVGASCFIALLLFDRMLADVEKEDIRPRDPGRVVIKTLGVIGCVGVVVLLVGAVAPLPPAARWMPAELGAGTELGLELFTLYLAPLQVLGLFLLAALVGASLFLRRRAG